MAKALGYGGLGNTNGARDFSGKAEATSEFVYRFRGNDTIQSRRRYGGLWTLLLTVLLYG